MSVYGTSILSEYPNSFSVIVGQRLGYDESEGFVMLEQMSEKMMTEQIGKTALNLQLAKVASSEATSDATESNKSSTTSSERRMPKVGDVATETRLITIETIEEFARVSGDINPIHLDPAYAAKSRFGQRVAHGMMAAVMLTKVAGTQLPGPGSIYLSQTMKFKKPVLIGDTITAEIKIIGQKAGKPLYTLSTIVRNQDGVVLLDGEAVVFYEPVDV